MERQSPVLTIAFDCGVNINSILVRNVTLIVRGMFFNTCHLLDYFFCGQINENVVHMW